MGFDHVLVYVEATSKQVTTLNITGGGITDGVITKTYGDATFTLTASAGSPGENSSWAWSSCVPYAVAEVQSTGTDTADITVKAVGDAKFTVNYTSDTSVGTTDILLHVDKKGVTVTGLATAGKDYDGTASAPVNAGAVAINGLTTADAEGGTVTVDAAFATASFEDKNAGNDNTVTFNGITLAGASARNYEITGINTAQADILPVSVTANVSAVSRAYVKDDLNVTLVPGAVAGVIGDDRVSVDVTNAVATMTDDAVGTDKAVTVSGVALTGEDAGNYTLSAQPAGVTVTIQKAVWTKTTAYAQVQAGANGQLDLTEYIAPGASAGTLSVVSGDEALDGAPALDGSGKLGFTFKAGTKDGTLAEVAVPVTGAASYNDYEITVTLKSQHEHVIEAVAAKNATCMEKGSAAHYRCTVEGCGKLFSDGNGENEITAESVRVPAQGHDWDAPSYVWAEDNSTVTATRICKRDDTHKETETAVTTHTDVAAACEAKGSVTYEAVFTGAAFEKQTKVVETDALEHDWGEWTEITPATETTPGEEQRVCKRDATHVEKRAIPPLNHAHIMIHHVRVEATATAPGSIEYWECSECHRYFSDSEGKTEISLESTVISAGGTTQDPDPTPKPENPLKDGEVYISAEDEAIYMIPAVTVKDVPVSAAVSGTAIAFTLKYTYLNAVTYTGSKILPETALDAELSPDELMAQVTFNEGVSLTAKDVLKVTYVKANNKEASRKKKATFYAKLAINKGINKQMSKAEYKKLKKLVSQSNKALKKNKCEFTINPKPITDCAPELVAKFNKDGTVKVAKKTGLISGVKGVWVTLAKRTKLAKSTYTLDVPVTAEDGKVTVKVTGKKNYTGTAVVEVKK